MAEVTLSDRETACVRQLGAVFNAGGRRFDVSQIPIDATFTEKDREAMIDRFVNFNLVAWDNIAVLRIQPPVMELVHQLDNPKPKDYWKQIGTWFRSRPWSVPVFVILVALPLLVQWVEMIQKLMKWLGVQK